MNEWKFVGQMDCDLCKYDCNSTEHCPYTAGWQDGQRKLLEYLIANAKHPPLDDSRRIYQDQLEKMLAQLEGQK